MSEIIPTVQQFETLLQSDHVNPQRLTELLRSGLQSIYLFRSCKESAALESLSMH